MRRIGLIGVGVVGTALKTWFEKQGRQIKAYDLLAERANCRFVDLLETDVCFVSVPTPTNRNGTQYLECLRGALKDLTDLKYKGIVAHKCTVVPGTTAKLRVEFPQLALVHYPEFLTEKNASRDFASQKIVLLSGKADHCFKVYETFNDEFQVAFSSHYESTEMAKYMHNCFLATKVAFFNEMFAACESLNVSYEKVLEMTTAVRGIGLNHTMVPGPDGRRGFSGMCFIKDTAAFSKWAQGAQVSVKILDAAIESNKQVRPTAYDGSENVGVLR